MKLLLLGGLKISKCTMMLTSMNVFAIIIISIEVTDLMDGNGICPSPKMTV